MSSLFSLPPSLPVESVRHRKIRPLHLQAQIGCYTQQLHSNPGVQI